MLDSGAAAAPTATARWLFDEGSGTTVADSIGDADMDASGIFGGTPAASWVGTAGSVGIDHDQASAGTDITTDLKGTTAELSAGVTQATVELVVDIATSVETWPLRLGTNLVIGFRLRTTDQLKMYAKQAGVAGTNYTLNSSGIGGAGKTVLHWVYDSTLANNDDRLAGYIDGSPITWSTPGTLTQDAGLESGGSVQNLIVFNSAPSIVRHVAIHWGTALSAAEVSSAAANLASDDDASPE